MTTRPSSLARSVTRRATFALVLALVAAGLGSGVLLHLQAVRALDTTLWAAAEAHAVPHPEPDWTDDTLPARFVQVSFVNPADTRHPAAVLAARVLGHAGPLAQTFEGRRWLVVDLAMSNAGVPPAGLPERVAAASAPAVTPLGSVGRFAVVYALVASVVAAAAAAALHRTLTEALTPLGRAAGDVQRVVGLGGGARVEATGPSEVVALLDAINALLDRLDTAWSSQTRFTADAAHELRTPVTILLGQLEVALRRERDAAELRDMLQPALEATRRLDALVDGLLSLTRLEAGEGQSSREPVTLSEVVALALAAERSTLDAAGVRVSVERVDDGLASLQPALAVSAVGNLLRNVAVHAPGHEAQVRVERRGTALAVVVDDDGPGLGDDAARLFQRLGRGAGSGQGLGLGLALAREIARRHGGDCTAGPSPSGGARFVWSVPALS